MDIESSWRTWSSSLHGVIGPPKLQDSMDPRLGEQAPWSEEGFLRKVSSDGKQRQIDNAELHSSIGSEQPSAQLVEVLSLTQACPDTTAGLQNECPDGRTDLPTGSVFTGSSQWLYHIHPEQDECPATVFAPATPATSNGAANNASGVRNRQSSISKDDMLSSPTPKLDMLAHRLGTWATADTEQTHHASSILSTPTARPSARSSASSSASSYSIHDSRHSSSAGSRASVHAADGLQLPNMDDMAMLEEDLVAAMKRLPASMRYGARNGAGGLIQQELLKQLYGRLQKLQVAHANLNSQLLEATQQLEAHDKVQLHATVKLHETELKKEHMSSRVQQGDMDDMSNVESLRVELIAARQEAGFERAARMRVEAAMEQQLLNASAATQAETARLDKQLLQAQQSLQTAASTTDVRAYITSRPHSSSSSTTDEHITLASTEGGDGLPQLTAKLVSDKAQQVAVVAVVDVAPAQHAGDMVPISLANQWRKALSAERAERQALAASLQHVKAELANTQQQAKQTSNSAREALAAAQRRVQSTEHQLQDTSAKVSSLEDMLKAYGVDMKGLNSKNVSLALELQQHQDVVHKLKLQVSVLEGSLEILQRALDTSREELAAARQQQREQDAAMQTLHAQMDDCAAAATAELHAVEAIAEQRTRSHIACLLELRNHPNLLPADTDAAARMPAGVPAPVTATRPRGGLSDGSFMALMKGPDEFTGACTAAIEGISVETPTTFPQAPTDGAQPPAEERDATSTAAIDASSPTSASLQRDPVEWHAGLEMLELQMEAAGDSSTSALDTTHVEHTTGEDDMHAILSVPDADGAAVEGSVPLPTQQQGLVVLPAIETSTLPDSQIASAQPSPKLQPRGIISDMEEVTDAVADEELLPVPKLLVDTPTSAMPEVSDAQHNSTQFLTVAAIPLTVSRQLSDNGSDSETPALEAPAAVTRRARILSQGETSPADSSSSPRLQRAPSRLARCTSSVGPSSPNNRTSMMAQHVAAAADVMRTLQEARQARARSHSGAAAAY